MPLIAVASDEWWVVTPQFECEVAEISPVDLTLTTDCRVTSTSDDPPKHLVVVQCGSKSQPRNILYTKELKYCEAATQILEKNASTQ